MTKTSFQQGFTLIELVIVVTIIGIIVSIALPNYYDSVRKTRRSEAQTALVQNMNVMERYFTENSRYDNILDASLAIESTNYYDINLVTSATSYSLSAAPQNSQTSDSCGTLSISSIGAKNKTGTGKCW
mgnify:CR=1 FL=1